MRRRAAKVDAPAEPLVWSCVIRGKPAPKKTSNRVVRAGQQGRLRVLPSAKHEAWVTHAILQARTAWRRAGHGEPYRGRVQVAARVYRGDNRRADLSNHLEAVGDMLERAGVIENDRLVASWDGSRLLFCDDQPRVEIEITNYPAFPDGSQEASE